MIHLNRPELRTKEHICSAMNVRSVDDHAIKIEWRELPTTFTSHLWGADNPGQGTGTWTSEQLQMTLTYRGQKYVRIQGADASKKAALTYRGVSYASWHAADQVETLRIIGAFFLLKLQVALQKGRPPLPDGRDGLSRSFVHVATHCSVKLVPWSVNGLIEQQWTERKWTERRRRAKRLAWWQTLGPLLPGVKPRFLQGHLNDAEETRLGWRSALSRQTNGSRMGWKLEQGPEKSACF